MSLNYLNEELERRILTGLSWEWGMIVYYYLPPNALQEFKKPLFELKEMASLGTWDGERKTIAINRQFILTHKWEYVVDVLVHEIAHQYVDTFLGIDASPHGPLFRQACERLRIRPDATAHYKKFTEAEPTGSHDRIVQKIHKLFALAQSENKNEAETAMLKAQALIHYYNIELIETEQKQDYVTQRLGECKLRHSRETYALVAFIAEYYFVQRMMIRSYIISKDKQGSVFEISGSRANVEIAHYVYDFICRYIDECWKNHHSTTLKRHKTDFALGIIAGFRDKISTRHLHDDSDTTALIRRSDLQLQEYMKYRYPRTVSRRRGARQSNKAAHQAGYQKGQEMVVNKGVTSTNKAQRGLLN